MRDDLPGDDLCAGGSDIAEELELLDHRLEGLEVEKDGRALAMLGEDDRLASLPNLFDELRGVRAEFGDRPDVWRASIGAWDPHKYGKKYR